DRRLTRLLASLAGCLAIVGCATLPPTRPVATGYRCDNPQGSVDRRACEMAAQGPEALRRFVERTRGIYELYYWDYIRTPTRGASVATSTRVAAASSRTP
ncbi:MAG TPA: hypothetical protein VJ891_14540, partial [Casimicrobiaceae bacterium]|nr:hypothetical protein [Casimicrobiaceae bacterium]